MTRHKRQRYEKYELKASPWAQKLTQRDLAKLLGFTKTQLEALIRDKEKWVSRRPEIISGKSRSLAVPYGKLRRVHERLKFHFNKLKQPDYLYSPRKGRSQRDNALRHVGQHQFLSIDIRQFYPSTTKEHMFRWAFHEVGLTEDVAGMLVHLISVDGKMPFGSPISPVFTAVIHRSMFDAIKRICDDHELEMTLWVDDLTISGRNVTGSVTELIRAEIRRYGFQTHKIAITSPNKPIIVTGVPVKRDRIEAPRSIHDRVRAGYAALRRPLSDADRAHEIDKLISALGSLRYHVGHSSVEGRRAADRMEALRNRRAKLTISVTTLPTKISPASRDTNSTCAGKLPWE